MRTAAQALTSSSSLADSRGEVRVLLVCGAEPDCDDDWLGLQDYDAEQEAAELEAAAHIWGDGGLD